MFPEGPGAREEEHSGTGKSAGGRANRKKKEATLMDLSEKRRRWDGLEFLSSLGH